MTDENTKTYTQEDIEALEVKHQEDLDKLAGKMRAEFKAKEQKAKEEAEKMAKQANMTDLQKAQDEANDWKTKYEQSQSTIELANQKEETRALLKELGIDASNLDFVFIPKDAEGTKARAQAFKEMIDNVKKTTFENNVNSKIPDKGSSSGKTQIDMMRKAMGLK